MKEGQKGFTLIELMVSTFIMVLVMGSAMYALNQAQMMTVESRSRLLAMQAARSTLETIKNTNLANVKTISTASLIPADLKNGAIAITTNPSNVSGSTVATVTVTVNWTGPRNMNRSLQISTMRSIY